MCKLLDVWNRKNKFSPFSLGMQKSFAPPPPPPKVVVVKKERENKTKYDCIDDTIDIDIDDDRDDEMREPR